MREPTAGDLRTRVSVRDWHDEATGFAAIDSIFGEPLKRWAKIIAASSATYWGSKQLDTGVTHLVVMRYLEPITGQQVLESGGWRYRILRVKHSTGAKRWTWLECELLGQVQ